MPTVSVRAPRVRATAPLCSARRAPVAPHHVTARHVTPISVGGRHRREPIARRWSTCCLARRMQHHHQQQCHCDGAPCGPSARAHVRMRTWSRANTQGARTLATAAPRMPALASLSHTQAPTLRSRLQHVGAGETWRAVTHTHTHTCARTTHSRHHATAVGLTRSHQRLALTLCTYLPHRVGSGGRRLSIPRP